MTNISKNQPRPLIKEFAKDILNSRIEITNNEPIPFRDDKVVHKIRKAYKVPIELLRFRKDNGRIASDVITWENSKGVINESTEYGQSLLRKFLELKDPGPTAELTNTLVKEGQDEYAVITADGFLINGNRRKMVLTNLLEKHKGDEKYKYLKVVILPGEDENEPLPTLLDIEQLENRYQYRRTGKAEYYNFDKALSIKRKVEMGMSLEEQLRDDPNYSELSSAEFKKQRAAFEEEYIKPLECIDKYLSYLGRPGHYNTISEGRGDSEGRWQAFLDYYNLVYKKLNDEKNRIKLGIQEEEVGKIENVAFKIIRKREIDGLGKKAHQIMRDFPKLISNANVKKELFILTKIDFNLPKTDIINEEGKEVDEKTKDIIWNNKNGKEIIWHVKKAYEILDHKKEHDTPISLLNAALDKLNHSDMIVDNIELSKLDVAMKLCKAIQLRGNEIEHAIFDAKKIKNKLGSKFNQK
ncbi:hypothetical protein SNE26_17760 [Mucilaginibacter sp. cycad4]|uniref:hypothetical protein n=1 Tax=Mucilaginibacter sp. cycad4 TaxID=3342096 RepID=UPI002AAAB86D|nr:hypothetical protein [Mucilaginibacter gossypii]WPU97876.1 hypothetical protein SNE26_17760 [Mucilaginibacter gossypii]